jgi:hypothetical protein
VSELGSIFDEPSAAGGGDKGPDLRVRATVRQSELEAGQPVLVPVPDRVAYEGGTVPRRREAGDPPGEVRLHLSAQLVDGTVLRLRRQGGEHPTSGVPGDLLVEVCIVPRREAGPRLVIGLALAAAAATAAVGWWSHGVWWG